MSEQEQQHDPYEGHTPGPWETYRDYDLIHVIRQGTLEYLNQSGSHVKAEWVAELDPEGTGHDETQTEADARLIADAPTLLQQTREQAARIAALEAEAAESRRRAEQAEQPPAGWVSGNGVLHLFADVEDMKAWMDAHPDQWGAAGCLRNTEWHPTPPARPSSAGA